MALLQGSVFSQKPIGLASRRAGPPAPAGARHALPHVPGPAVPSSRGCRRSGRTPLLLPTAAAAVEAPANGAPLLNGAAAAAAAAAASAAPAAAAPAPAFPPPEAFRDISPPPKAYEIIVNQGAARVGMSWQKVLGMGVLAGIHIGIGGLLVMTVGAACPGLAASNPGLHKMVIGSFGLPVGLIMVMVCGAELFTGNVVMMSAAVAEGRASLGDLAHNWFFSFIGNFIGALALVGLVCGTGLMANAAGPVAAAVGKTSLTFTQAFTRGILANWLVCVAVWMASACNSFPGKFMAAWIAVSTFTAIGFEHSIANMFIITLGVAIGAPVTMAKFLVANLLPVTLGNIVGGAALAVFYSLAFGKKPQQQPKAA